MCVRRPAKGHWQVRTKQTIYKGIFGHTTRRKDVSVAGEHERRGVQTPHIRTAHINSYQEVDWSNQSTMGILSGTTQNPTYSTHSMFPTGRQRVSDYYLLSRLLHHRRHLMYYVIYCIPNIFITIVPYTYYYSYIRITKGITSSLISPGITTDVIDRIWAILCHTLELHHFR